jgi:phosphate transport system substrate-binding protein
MHASRTLQNSLSGLALAACVTLALAGCTFPKEDSPSSGRLNGLVSESQFALTMVQAEQFEHMYPDAHVTLRATSTRDAIVQFLNDSVRFICVDRPFNTEERAVAKHAEKEFDEIAVAEDALAFIVHRDNPAQEITQDAIRGIASGSLTDWKTVASTTSGGIQLAMTGKNSGTYELLMRHFLKLQTDAPVAFVADSQSAVVDFVAEHPRAIGVVSVSAIRDTSKQIRALMVERIDTTTGAKEFVKLHQANIYQERYPYHYPVYVYSLIGVRGVHQGLTTFIASAPGQKNIQKAGLVPKTMPVRLVKLNKEQLP